METYFLFLVPLFLAFCGKENNEPSKKDLKEPSLSTDFGEIPLQPDLPHLYKVCTNNSPSKLCLTITNEEAVPFPLFGCRNVLRSIAAYFKVDNIEHLILPKFDPRLLFEEKFQEYYNFQTFSSPEIKEGKWQEFKNAILEEFLNEFKTQSESFLDRHQKFSRKIPSFFNSILLMNLILLDEDTQKIGKMEFFKECTYALEDKNQVLPEPTHIQEVLKYVEPKRKLGIETPFIQKEVEQYFILILSFYDTLSIKRDVIFQTKLEADLRDHFHIIKDSGIGYSCVSDDPLSLCRFIKPQHTYIENFLASEAFLSNKEEYLKMKNNGIPGVWEEPDAFEKEWNRALLKTQKELHFCGLQFKDKGIIPFSDGFKPSCDENKLVTALTKVLFLDEAGKFFAENEEEKALEYLEKALKI